MLEIFADFNCADRQGRLRLDVKGAIESISRSNIDLRKSGQEYIFSDGDVSAVGRVVWSEEESIWVGVIDWSEVQSFD